MTGEDTSRPGLRRWLILALLLGLTVGSLGFVGWAWGARTDEANPVDAAEQLREDAGDPRATRAELRDLAETFVEDFYTYRPDDVVEGKLPEYEERLTAMMSAKFRSAFEDNLPLVEGVASQSGVGSTADAQASGVVTADVDSAEVLVGGWVQFTYANPDEQEERIEGDRQPVRYRVLMVRVDGRWLVDNLDSVDDSLPGLADEPTDGVPAPGATPSGAAPDEGTAPTAPGTGGSPTAPASEQSGGGS